MEEEWDISGSTWADGVSQRMGEAFYADVKRHEHQEKRCHEIMDCVGVPRVTPGGDTLSLSDRVEYLALRK